MYVGDLRKQIREGYGIACIESETIMLDNDFYSLDGINDSSLIYVAARVSDGKILRHVISDFEGVILTSSNPRGVGTIAQLRALGVDWHDIFVEADCHSTPNTRTVEDF